MKINGTKENKKMADSNPSISIIAFYMNGLIIPIKC